jgi:hypothetical protein
LTLDVPETPEVLPSRCEAEHAIRPAANDIRVMVVLVVVLPAANRAYFEGASLGKRGRSATRARSFCHLMFRRWRVSLGSGPSVATRGAEEISNDWHGARLRIMRPTGWPRTWREWFFETFGRGGYFSLRPMPKTEAERQLQADKNATPPKDLTRLNLDPDQPRQSN